MRNDAEAAAERQTERQREQADPTMRKTTCRQGWTGVSHSVPHDHGPYLARGLCHCLLSPGLDPAPAPVLDPYLVLGTLDPSRESAARGLGHRVSNVNANASARRDHEAEVEARCEDGHDAHMRHWLGVDLIADR